MSTSVYTYTPLRKFKCVLLGHQAVGKTALVYRFMYNSFDNNYQSTVGIDFLSKTMNLDNGMIRLQIWDTAGQERYHSLAPQYVRDSVAAIIVYDVTKVQTFHESSKWIEIVRKERGNNAVIILVGNKTDQEEERKVSWVEGEQKAKELNLLFIETSAKLGYNVQTLFRKIAGVLTDTKSFHGGNGITLFPSSKVNFEEMVEIFWRITHV
jgi:small GTP-binding protein